VDFRHFHKLARTIFPLGCLECHLLSLLQQLTHFFRARPYRLFAIGRALFKQLGPRILSFIKVNWSYFYFL